MSEDKGVEKDVKVGDDFEQMINKFSRYLIIDKEALDNECMVHTVRFDEICDAHIKAQEMLDKAKYLTETTYAELDVQIRKENESKGKITEAYISNLILTNPIYRQLSEGLFELKKKERRLSKLIENFIQRSQRIDNLCRLYSAGYFEREQVKKGGEKAFETSFMDRIKTKQCVGSTTDVSEVLKNLKNKQG